MNIKLLFLFLATIILLNCSHSTDPDYNADDFGIYLLSETLLNTDEIKDVPIGELKLQTTALINLDDIIEYNWDEQLITLTEDGNKKLKSFDTKQISVYGMPFVVVAETKRIYVGNIYPMYSSILQPDFPMIQVAPFLELKIFRAMPESSSDKRKDERIYNVMKTFNKLTD